ncbi:MAG: OmpA family protein [Spirochaetia bacterium]|nr:OmpA family protein [Spirochaetia bacterium]
MAARRKNKGGGEAPKGGGGESGSGRWMLTYLDMVTLLFGVFVILYAISKVEPHKTDVVVQSIKMGFAGGINPFKGRESGGSTIFENLKPNGLTIEKDRINERNEDLLKNQLQKVHIAFVEEERGIVISLFNDIYFETGKADLNQESKNLIERLSPILADMDRDIRVEGHTDEVPAAPRKGKPDYDNFNLAGDRAVAVLHQLRRGGVDPSRMAAISYGDAKPNEAERSPVGKALNRVVDIVILKRDFVNKSPEE